MLFEVTVTRTGSIIVEAQSKEEAYDTVLRLKCSEINEQGNLTGWEPSDVDELTSSNQLYSSVFKKQRLLNCDEHMELELINEQNEVYDTLHLRLICNEVDLNLLNNSIYYHFKKMGYESLYDVQSYEVEDYLIDEFGLSENEERKREYGK